MSRIVPDARVQLRFEKFAAFVEEFRPKISLGGMFLETEQPKPLGSTIACEFKLTDGFRLCRTLGEVVWVRRNGSPGAPAGVGIRFDAIDDEGRELILKILEEQVKSGGEPFEIERVPPGAEVAGEEAPEGPRQLDLPTVGPLSEDDTLSFEAAEVLPSVAAPAKSAAAGSGGGGEFDAPWGDGLPEFPEDVLDPVDEAALPELAEADFSSDPREAGFALDGDSDLLEIEPLDDVAVPVPASPVAAAMTAPSMTAPSMPETEEPEALELDDLSMEIPDFGIEDDEFDEGEPDFGFEPEADSGDADFEEEVPSTLVTPAVGDDGPGSAWSAPLVSDGGISGTTSSEEEEESVRHTDLIDEPLPDLDLPEEMAAPQGLDDPLGVPASKEEAWVDDSWDNNEAWEDDGEAEWEEEAPADGFFAQLKFALAESKGRLLAVLILLAVVGAGFFFKEPLLSLAGLGSSEVAESAHDAPEAGPSDVLPEEAAAETVPDAMADAGESDAATSDDGAIEVAETDLDPEIIELGDAPPPSLPPAAAPQPSVERVEPPPRSSTERPAMGRPAAAIQTLTHRQSADGTLVTIQLDGSIDEAHVEHQLLDYDPLKEQIVIRGIDQPYASQVKVGTLELDRIRTGLHAGPSGSEIRLVFDLSSERVKVGEIRTQGDRLEILVRRR